MRQALQRLEIKSAASHTVPLLVPDLSLFLSLFPVHAVLVQRRTVEQVHEHCVRRPPHPHVDVARRSEARVQLEHLGEAVQVAGCVEQRSKPAGQPAVPVAEQM